MKGTPLIQRILLLTALLFLLASCSDSDDDSTCDPGSVWVSENGICLSIQHDGLSPMLTKKIENLVITGISEINNLLPVDNLRITITDNTGLVIPEIGIGGYNPGPNEVIIAVNKNFNGIEASLDENLIAQLAHEIHHAMRRRSVGYGNTLFQAIITEGLADHFSIEVTGIDPPPWSVALQEPELEKWIDKASMTWHEASYDHYAWFGGTDPLIPRWTGYAMGYKIVLDYLNERPDEKPLELANEPANSFQP